MKRIAFLLAFSLALAAQNPVMTGPKVDLSFAQHTRPWALSATPLTLPTTGCLQGEVQYVISVNMLYVASPSCIWLPLVGGSGGSSAFSALTPGTNTNSGSFVFGTGTHLSASGTGTIAATTVAGFTPGAGLLTGPTAPLTLTPGGIGGIWSGCSSGSPLMSYTGNCVAGGGGGGGGSYIASATTSPMLVTAATHGQGINAVAFCFDGTVSGSTTSGSQVECGATKDISGNITITWGGSAVGSIQIFSSGAGPAGPSGNSPAPYITNATTAPQTILASTHGQGANPIVACWSGAVSGTHVTGSYVVCPYEQNPAGAPGDLIVSYTSGDVGSIWVGSAGSGGAGLGDPGAAGLVYRTGLDVTRPGVYGDIFTLFTGCSGSDYPGFDGACHAAVGSGTVTSITVTVPSILNVSPATITTSGTFALSLTTQSAATFFAGPVTGSAAAPAFRAFAATDLAGLTLTNSTTGNAATSTTANSLVAQAADTVVMNATGGSASPSAVAMPTTGTNGCSGTSNALIYNTNTHSWGCNTISGGGGGNVSTTGTITTNALTTMADSTHIQTPASATMDANGDIASGGWISFLHGWWCAQSTDINGGGTPIAGGANSFGIICPTSIPNAYRWKVPSADAAGVLMSDGLGGTTPYVGTLSISSAPIISAANMTSFPTLNQSTTGNAATATTSANVTGGVVGSIPYQSAASTTAMLAGNTASTDKVLVSHGTGSVGQAPTLSNAPALSAANMTSFPSLPYAPATNGTSGQALTSNGTGGFGTAVTLGGAATHGASVTVNSQTCTLDSSCTIAAGVTGTGTANYLPKFTSGTAVGNSSLTDDGTVVATAISAKVSPSSNFGLCIVPSTTSSLFSNCGTMPYFGWNNLIPAGFWFGSNAPTGVFAVGEYHHFDVTLPTGPYYGGFFETTTTSGMTGGNAYTTMSNVNHYGAGAATGSYSECLNHGVGACQGSAIEVHQYVNAQADDRNLSTFCSGYDITSELHSCYNIFGNAQYPATYQALVSDMVTNGTATITSASGPFVSGMAGTTGVLIVNQNNNVIPPILYKIISVTNSQTAVVDRNVGTLSGQTAYIGWNPVPAMYQTITQGGSIGGLVVQEHSNGAALGKFDKSAYFISSNTHANSIVLVNAPNTSNTATGNVNRIQFVHGSNGENYALPFVQNQSGWETARIETDINSGDPTSGNLTISAATGGTLTQAAKFGPGTVAIGTGTNVLYRCTVAGTLRVGQTTTVAGDCGTAVDTGLRVQ